MNHKTPILQSAAARAQSDAKRDSERRTIAEGARMAIMATPISEIVQILGNVHVNLDDPENVKLTIQSPGASRAYRLEVSSAFVLSIAEQLEARATEAAADPAEAPAPAELEPVTVT